MSRRGKKGYVPFEEMPSTQIGRNGEKIIETALPFGDRCWRYTACAGRCAYAHNRLNTKPTAQAGKADADIIVSFKCCDNAGNRCQFLKDGDTAEFVSLHEVKTNPAAVDASIVGFSAYTENLYVEMVQHEKNYILAYREKLTAESKGETWGKDVYGYQRELDPLEDNSMAEHYVEYLDGIGWWPKREYSYKRGDVSYLHAGWYHFYQPYDTWEWVKKKRGKCNPKGYKEARKSEIEKFLSDEKIEDGSILLVQYPVELCISIEGEHLEKIIDKNIEAAIKQGVCIPRRSKNYADNGYDLHYKGSSGNALVLGYMMPIEKLIPCREANKRIARKNFEPLEMAIWGERTIIDEENKKMWREKAVDENGNNVEGIAERRDRLIKEREEKLLKGENVDSIRQDIEAITQEWKRYEKNIGEYTKGIDGIRTSIIGKFVEKGGDGIPVKKAIPINVKAIYAPRRIMGKAIKGGMLLYPLKPFERIWKYNREGKKYVPRVIEEFAYHVKPYV